MRRLWLAGALLLLVAPVWAANPTTFTWTGSVVDATHFAPTAYTVKCGTIAGGPYPFAGTVTGSPVPTSEAISAVLNLAGNFFCVAVAMNAGGTSGPSNEVSFLFGTPNAPTLLQAQ